MNSPVHAQDEAGWDVLVVDDEEDIHSVTRLALKNKTWRRRKFTLTHARSAAEAKQILSQPGKDFRVALVDVVMETDDAGLKLAGWIRAFCPNSLRIILRTGQAGVAPEHYVLNQYDIDYYVHKAELDVDRLYRVISSALRSSQDIATLLSFGAQLRNFTAALQKVSTVEDLRLFMMQGLEFLGSKHDATLRFYHDLERDVVELQAPEQRAEAEALLALHERGVDLLKPLANSVHGMGDTTSVTLFDVNLETRQTTDAPTTVRAAVVASFSPQIMTASTVEGCARDLAMFIENWRTAYVALQLQRRVAEERMLREQMFYDRLQMIANMVAGVAHEINTPLGVASTANSMISSLSHELVDRLKNAQPAADLVTDLEEATRLLDKNLQRAHQLIKSFKQLSSSSLSDHRTQTSVLVIVRDCVETLTPETRKRQLKIEVKADPPDDPMAWDGFPGYLEHVVINLIQNVMKHGYPDSGGRLEIRLAMLNNKGVLSYKLEFQDWGKGIPAEILPKVFDPFVTTKRSEGGTGLGLAIARNIVSDLLRGTITVKSTFGEGTTFTLIIPKVVPQPAGRLSAQPPPLSI